MAFTKKEWKDRVSAYPTRRKLLDASNNETIVTVSRYEGEVTEDGDAFSAENMNDLEDRIEDGFNSIPEPVVDTAISSTSTNPVQNKVISSALDGKANSSHTHGNIQNGGTLQTNDVAIASGDKLVVTDASNSNRVARTSSSFDGSTTNKYLSPKGTWENLKCGVNASDRVYYLAIMPTTDQTYTWTVTKDCVAYMYIGSYSHIWIDNVKVYSSESQQADPLPLTTIPLKQGQVLKTINIAVKAYALK